MPTTNLGLPLITGNQTADVVRDMNALAEDIDIKAAKKQDLTTHLAEDASLTKKGHVQLSNSITGTSQVLGATEKAVNDAVNLLKEWAPNKSTHVIVANLDPNTTLNSLIFSEHPNNPTSSGSYYILTQFYSTLSSEGNFQIAMYDTSEPIAYFRTRATGVWGPWRRIMTEISGIGSPEGVITAAIGTLYLNKNGGTSTTLYVKTSGVGNTGWTAK